MNDLKTLLTENPGLAFYLVGLSILLCLIVVEVVMAILLKKKIYSLKDTVTNFTMYIGYITALSVWGPITYGIFYFVHQSAVFDFGSYWMLPQSLHFWWQWGLLLVLDDFCFYVFHYASHKYRFLWASHVNHHSSKEFNFSVGFRQSWTPFLSFLFWIPLCFIGFDPIMVISMHLMSLFYQGCQHTRLIKSYGVFELIYNTPSHHRVHHGRNNQYINKNFGGVFIIWDRMFGTFSPEIEEVEYGLKQDINTFNPIKVAFHEWRSIIMSIVKAKSLKDIAKAVFGILIVLNLQGCIDNALITRTQKNLSKIKSYQGTLVESGFVKGAELKTKIFYKAPEKFRIKVVQPKIYEGISINFNKDKLSLYYPMLNWAIIYKGIKVSSTQEINKIIEESYKYQLKKFDYTIEDTSEVASLPTINISYKSKSKTKTFNTLGHSNIYDKYSFPLGGFMKFVGGSEYKYYFEKIEFNKKIKNNEFILNIPKSTFISTWDFKKKGVSDKEVMSVSELKVPILSKGVFALEKIKTIQVDRGLPVFTTIYKKGPYFLYVTFFKDTIGVSENFKYGIPIGGKNKGRLTVTPVLSSYTFNKDKVVYMLVTNIPSEELLSLSQKL